MSSGKGRRGPGRALGQNFLVNRRVAGRLVRNLGPEPGDTVIEIGPGRGALTGLLAGRCARLFLVERDLGLAAALAKRARGRGDIAVVLADAARLRFDGSYRGPGRVLAVGNLPYAASTAILFNLLEHGGLFDRMVLMFQREVAARLLAAPGDRRFGAMSMLTALGSEVEHVFDVPPDDFRPRPRVWSTVVAVTPRKDRAVSARGGNADLAHALFAQPRKTAVNSLAVGLGITSEASRGLLVEAGVTPDARPCLVTPEQFLALRAALKGSTPGPRRPRARPGHPRPRRSRPGRDS